MIFQSITSRFQFKFKDRVTAVGILAELLKDKLSREEQNSAIVLGIPRGGVVIADVIARKLSCKFDLDNKEHAIGAITEDGTTYLDFTAE